MPVPESPRTSIVDVRNGGLSREWIRYFSDLAAYLAGLVTGVTTVFGRSGTVVSASGDYAASQVTNDSSVTGANTKLALNALLAAIPTTATTSTAGTVKQATSVAQLAGVYSSSVVAAKVDELLAAMIIAGQMASSS